MTKKLSPWLSSSWAIAPTGRRRPDHRAGGRRRTRTIASGGVPGERRDVEHDDARPPIAIAESCF
jgi:hypothetical protein